MHRKETANGLSGSRYRGESNNCDNDIPPDEREHSSRGIHGILRTMSVVDVHILNFCLGFSAGRYNYFWNVLQENISMENFPIQVKKQSTRISEWQGQN